MKPPVSPSPWEETTIKDYVRLADLVARFEAVVIRLEAAQKTPEEQTKEIDKFIQRWRAGNGVSNEDEM